MSLEEGMEESIENSIDTLATLSTFLDDLVLQTSKMDFISFVRLVAPTIVSDWKMGRHIKILSDKLQKVQDGGRPEDRQLARNSAGPVPTRKHRKGASKKGAVC